MTYTVSGGALNSAHSRTHYLRCVYNDKLVNAVKSNLRYFYGAFTIVLWGGLSQRGHTLTNVNTKVTHLKTFSDF